MATSHVVDGATEHRLLRPAAPTEVSAELLGRSDDDALRATQESSCRLLPASSGGHSTDASGKRAMTDPSPEFGGRGRWPPMWLVFRGRLGVTPFAGTGVCDH
jgi:hypothetical protein